MLPSLMRRYEVIVIPPVMERAKKIREIKASGAILSISFLDKVLFIFLTYVRIDASPILCILVPFFCVAFESFLFASVLTFRIISTRFLASSIFATTSSYVPLPFIAISSIYVPLLFIATSSIYVPLLFIKF